MRLLFNSAVPSCWTNPTVADAVTSPGHRRRSNVPMSQPRALDDPYVTAAGDNILDLKFSALLLHSLLGFGAFGCMRMELRFVVVIVRRVFSCVLDAHADPAAC